MARPAAVVVGSGLGGLLAAEMLARRGWRVTVLERLRRPGGKFTGLDIDGFQVPTGAFHTIPYGSRGFLGQALRAAGVRLRLAEQPVGFVVREGRRRLRPVPGTGWLWRRVPRWTDDLDEMWRSRRLAAALLAPHRPIPDVPLPEFLDDCQVGPALRRLLGKVVAYSNGARIERASAVEFVAGARLALDWPCAVIRGGCRHVIDRLLERLRSLGVIVRLGARVERVEVTAGRVRGVVCGGSHVPADLVVSNIGPSGTARLLGSDCPAWLSRRVGEVSPAHCIAYAIRSRRSLVPHPCVELPTHAHRIVGYVQVTAAAPELAPPGWHLLLALSLLDGEGVRSAIDTDRHQILQLFPSVGPEDVFHVSVYQQRHPAAETPAVTGAYGSGRYPLAVRGVDGLLMIGHDSVGIGYAAETIGYAALRLPRVIERLASEVGVARPN